MRIYNRPSSFILGTMKSTTIRAIPAIATPAAKTIIIGFGPGGGVVPVVVVDVVSVVVVVVVVVVVSVSGSTDTSTESLS